MFYIHYQYQRTIQNLPTSLAEQAGGRVGGQRKNPGLLFQKRREEKALQSRKNEIRAQRDGRSLGLALVHLGRPCSASSLDS